MKRKTVIVVGAGASSEVGMPMGPALAGLIADRVIDRSRKDIANAIATSGASLETYHLAAKKIYDGIGLANSIDEFLEAFRDQPEMLRMGKAGIVSVILAQERQCKLFVEGHDRAIPFRSLDNCWLVQFMKMITRGSTPPVELFNNLSFVVFNYDRCLEHFLLKALPARYDITQNVAVDIVRRIDIWHPYGCVGDHPDIGGIGTRVPFGSELTDKLIAQLAPSIRTYSEEMQETEHRDRMKATIADASQVVFLGMALHDQNLALIKPEAGIAGNIYATFYKVSDFKKAHMTKQLQEFAQGKAAIGGVNMTCSDLLAEYGATIFA